MGITKLQAKSTDTHININHIHITKWRKCMSVFTSAWIYLHSSYPLFPAAAAYWGGMRDVRQCSCSAPVSPAVFSTIGQTDYLQCLVNNAIT